MNLMDGLVNITLKHMYGLNQYVTILKVKVDFSKESYKLKRV